MYYHLALQNRLHWNKMQCKVSLRTLHYLNMLQGFTHLHFAYFGDLIILRYLCSCNLIYAMETVLK